MQTTGDKEERTGKEISRIREIEGRERERERERESSQRKHPPTHTEWLIRVSQ